MGNQLSRPSLTPSEQEFYLQVKATFVGAKFCFSRGHLKRFIHWIFKCFPDTELRYVLLDSFWDQVGRKLNVAQFEVDFSVARFFPLFKLIIRAIEGMSSRKEKGEVWVPLPLFPHPVILNSSLSEGGLVDVFCGPALGSHCLPNTSQPSFCPSQAGAGHTDPDSLLTLLPMPTYPSLPPSQVNSSLCIQDGAGNVAGPAIFPPPCPSFPAFSTQNGHHLTTSSAFPMHPTTQASRDPLPQVSMGVTTLGSSPAIRNTPSGGSTHSTACPTPS